MGKKKVLIVGLPLFTERLQKELSEFCPEWKFIRLDTYYSKKDKFKALLHIPTCDLIFSINGSITKSQVFNLALKFKKKIIMNWVGTDVLKAVQAFKTKSFCKEYISGVTHFCEVGWIKDELIEIGIHADVVSFASFNKKQSVFSQEKASNILNVLSYIPEERSDFYGINTFINLSKRLPDINFIIVGSKALKYLPLPSNLEAKGWVNEMDTIFDNADVCIRFPEHDGLSNFILEGLSRGKQVLYKYPFDYCINCISEESLYSSLKLLNSKKNNGEVLVNYEAMKFIENNYNTDFVMSTLIRKISQLIEK